MMKQPGLMLTLLPASALIPAAFAARSGSDHVAEQNGGATLSRRPDGPLQKEI